MKFLLIFFMLISLKDIYAQTQTRVGFLPSVNYNQKINKVWEANFKFESRHFVFENSTSQSSVFKYKYSLSDVTALVGRKVGLNSKVILGFLTRIEPEAVTYRTIQQFIFQTKIEKFRVAHRLVTDQTFSSNESTEFRLRYRLSAEIPLSGLKVDVKEFYLKFNTEALHSIQDDEYDLELRAVPNIGYVINDQHKIELGLDNRFASFIDNQTHFTSWLTINWFF
ncbi:DUF2490 domain-containing protein [Pedobacter alpinus]|uniref:DUF2490 domain-containing protein n=2 Tax=Pedobacter alpinus TaxID=1590643 RepID=A0ABW5TSB8_9SPHI